MATRYRSKFERMIGESNPEAKYEAMVLEYLVPEKPHVYTPDWLLPNGVIVETKGRFTYYDREKMLQVKRNHPDADIRFVFQRDNKMSRTSKQRYSDWCVKHGFQYAIGNIPESWYSERGDTTDE